MTLWRLRSFLKTTFWSSGGLCSFLFYIISLAIIEVESRHCPIPDPGKECGSASKIWHGRCASGNNCYRKCRNLEAAEYGRCVGYIHSKCFCYMYISNA
ncbi:hypothetical protein RGQ29_005249 [Quercus rubra]|uniref:Knottins-like domain-containing protein n=1 Tax=Quercus rubra TaxID=3512 RepID=A0AAN7E4Q1_QUERU|nr:hypothetical protein RGQ29_005249 [Quercus rubra]